MSKTSNSGKSDRLGYGSALGTQKWTCSFPNNTIFSSDLAMSGSPSNKVCKPDLVAAGVDDLHDVRRQRVLLPVPDGVGDLAALGGDAVVLPEDTPVPVRHLLQLLLHPVPVVPALLGLLLTNLLQSDPEGWEGERGVLRVMKPWLGLDRILLMLTKWPRNNKKNSSKVYFNSKREIIKTQENSDGA